MNENNTNVETNEGTAALVQAVKDGFAESDKNADHLSSKVGLSSKQRLELRAADIDKQEEMVATMQAENKRIEEKKRVGGSSFADRANTCEKKIREADNLWGTKTNNGIWGQQL